MPRDPETKARFSTVTPDDPRQPALLALNNAHAEALSWIEPARFSQLLSEAFLAVATPPFGAATSGVIQADAMLIAFDQDARYGSPNFLWFRARYERFVYVDRIVVAPEARGRGLARQLYHQLASAACAAGHAHLVCEVNLSPPNPGSDAFHQALGFYEVGRGEIPGGKTVRYLHRELPLNTG